MKLKRPGWIAAGLGLRKLRVELADLVEDLDVGGRVGARRAADGRLVDGDQAVEVLQALDAVVGAGVAQAGVQIAPQGLDEDVADQRALARAGNPGDAHEQAQGDLHVDVLQVVVPCAADHEALAVAGRRRAAGTSIRRVPARYWPVTLSGLGDHRGQRAGGHDLAPANAGTGTEIDEVVGRPHRVFVVLDHDHRVSLVAKLGQGRQQLAVVAGVQADRGLVEDVEHAHQAAADLPGQADALHFAAGEGGGGAVQREVLEPHVFEEPQAAADLLQRFGGDGLPVGVQLQCAEERPRHRGSAARDFGQARSRRPRNSRRGAGERHGRRPGH